MCTSVKPQNYVKTVYVCSSATSENDKLLNQAMSVMITIVVMNQIAQIVSDIAKGAKALPNACCALPPKLQQNRDTLI